MAKVTNISDGPRGAYLKGNLVWAIPGEEIEADDFNEEWFEAAEVKRGRPLKAKDDEKS